MAFITEQYPDMAVVAKAATNDDQHQPQPQQPPEPVIDQELRQQVHQALGIEVQMSQVPDVMQSLQQSISASVSARASKPTAASQAENEAATAFLNSLDTVNVAPITQDDTIDQCLEAQQLDEAQQSLQEAGALFGSLQQSIDLDWAALTASATVPSCNVVEADSVAPHGTSDSAIPTANVGHGQQTQPEAACGQTSTLRQRLLDRIRWPAFGLRNKLAVLYDRSMIGVMFGFFTGSYVASQLLGLVHDHDIRLGADWLTIIGSLLDRRLVTTRAGCVVFSGMVTGSLVTVPVIVVGSTGLFVSAAVYHTWKLATAPVRLLRN
jgi:hypothetical protein